MNATRYTDFDEFRENGGPGSYHISECRLTEKTVVRGMAIKCAGCGSESYLPLNPEDNGWEWDGNSESPTLKPSVFHTKEKGGCGWHGYLKAGVWQSV